ncbi:hypothetical protein RDI58_015198 [Solanum bulbocastanum]|uniref:Uncharacterized protein n=1 Tax=Solanum bulbocastanum TaxID=147425 RepID=A0AAN8YER6_SOLBU
MLGKRDLEKLYEVLT